jgi:hypothetical protein
MSEVSIPQLWSRSWKLFKVNWLPLAGSLIITLLFLKLSKDSRFKGARLRPFFLEMGYLVARHGKVSLEELFRNLSSTSSFFTLILWIFALTLWILPVGLIVVGYYAMLVGYLGLYSSDKLYALVILTPIGMLLVAGFLFLIMLLSLPGIGALLIVAELILSLRSSDSVGIIGGAILIVGGLLKILFDLWHSAGFEFNVFMEGFISFFILNLFGWAAPYAILSGRAETFYSALRQSFSLTAQNFGTVFMTLLWYIGFLTLGLLPCGLGLLVVLPMGFVFWPLLYLALTGEEGASHS